MSETTGRNVPVQRGDSPPLGEGTRTWHQSFETAKTHVSCAAVWLEVMMARVKVARADLRKCHKWDPIVFYIENWLAHLIHELTCNDVMYDVLLRPEEPGPGEKPEGGGGSEVDGLLKGLEGHDVRQPESLDASQPASDDDTCGECRASGAQDGGELDRH